MRLTIERSALLKALNHVQSVVERRNTIPILSNVLVSAQGDSLRLTATDLDIEISEQAPGEIERGGQTTAPADRRGHALDDGEIHVGRRQSKRTVGGLDQHVGEDRDGVAPFDDALHMRQGLQEGAALDGKFHGVLELSLGSKLRPAGSAARPNRAGEAGRRDSPGYYSKSP